MSRPREELQQILENLMSEAYEALPDDVRNVTPNFRGMCIFRLRQESSILQSSMNGRVPIHSSLMTLHTSMRSVTK